MSWPIILEKGGKMGNKYTQSQAQASKKYLQKMEEIKIRVPKGKKEEYRKMAAAVGKSLNQYIIDILEDNKNIMESE